MSRQFIQAWMPLTAVLVLSMPLLSGDGAGAKKQSEESTSPAAAAIARDILARFTKEEPSWKVRMECLVRLTRAGPGVIPVLVDGLKTGSPRAREIAAQTLGIVADASTRPALEAALKDPETHVRIYAINALAMLGRLEPTDRYRDIAENDSWAVRRHMEFALGPDVPLKPAALRQALADFDPARIDSARVGQVAVDFSLTDLVGSRHHLKQLRGKAVIVLFLTIA